MTFLRAGKYYVMILIFLFRSNSKFKELFKLDNIKEIEKTQKDLYSFGKKLQRNKELDWLNRVLRPKCDLCSIKLTDVTSMTNCDHKFC
jgi:hypothetical protein